MTKLDDRVETALEHALGNPVRITGRAPLGGGCISQTTRLETTAGQFVLKANPDVPDGFFGAEAEGLVALRESGTTLAIPRVFACDEAFIVLEYLDAAPAGPGFDVALGRGLAELHRSPAARFGFHRDTYCGLTVQPNAWTETWVEFYGHARLGHQLRLAVSAGHVSSGERALLEQLIDRLETWIGEPADGPALVHGDLWSGNLHRDASGRPGLIDPAVYFAHREAELGMMMLFGGFSERVVAAYDEAYPLEPGWRERNDLYQLYHLMNHLNLFGRGYHGQVMAIVRRYV